MFIVMQSMFKITPTNGELLKIGLPSELQQSFQKYHREFGNFDSLVAVLIPAFNEEGSIAEVIARIPTSPCGLKTTIIVVNDGSSDRTSLVARSAGATILDMPANSGQGAALKAGYLLALQNGSEYIAVVDADGQWDPVDLENLIQPLLTGEADFTQGSRKLGSSEAGDRFRTVGVEFFSRLISFLLGVRIGDTSSGIRAYRKQVLEKVRLDQPQYQSSEILISAICSGARLYELPVTMSARSIGESKKAANWKYGIYYLRTVLVTTFRDKYLARLPGKKN